MIKNIVKIEKDELKNIPHSIKYKRTTKKINKFRTKKITLTFIPCLYTHNILPSL